MFVQEMINLFNQAFPLTVIFSLFPSEHCICTIILQFLVLAIWIKTPINTSVKENLESATIIQGFGARSVADLLELH